MNSFVFRRKYIKQCGHTKIVWPGVDIYVFTYGINNSKAINGSRTHISCLRGNRTTFILLWQELIGEGISPSPRSEEQTSPIWLFSHITIPLMFFCVLQMGPHLFFYVRTMNYYCVLRFECLPIRI